MSRPSRPRLEHLLAQLDLVPGDLGVVAVDVGPGLFTGLRVGVAAAKGLAQALGIGIVGATSLDILTAGPPPPACRGLVLACVDARRGEVFAAVHEVDTATAVPAVRLAAGLFAPEGLAAALGGLAGAPVLAVGDGACATPTCCRRCPGSTAGRRAWPSPHRRRCSTSPAPGWTSGNRQSSPPRSFLSICVRRTPRATLPAPCGPEDGGNVTLRMEKLKRRDLRHVLRIEARSSPSRGRSRSSTPSWRCARAASTAPCGTATRWRATSAS